jgi:hypothetical protein
MKKIYRFSSLLIIIFAYQLINTSVFAQSPQKMSYQAVIRNSSNTLITSSPVGMRISILQGSATGTPVYVETQTPATNANGLVSLEIGGGTPVTGTFGAIDWAAGPYYIKTETDPLGGTTYTISGTSQLLSVPYALYASKVAIRASVTGDTLYSGTGNYVIIPGISAANLPSFVFAKTVSGFEQIFSANIDFTSIKQLTSGDINCNHPRISPDGKKVAYAQGTGMQNDIWVMNIDGSNKTKITNTNVNNLLPAWHNNGREIIYEYNNGVNTKVVNRIVRTDGTNDRLLIDVGNKDRMPSMNLADSNLVVFYYDAGNWAYSSDLRIRNLAGNSNIVTVVNLLFGGNMKTEVVRRSKQLIFLQKPLIQ